MDNFNFKILKSASGRQISETPNGVVRVDSDFKLSEKATDSDWDYYYDKKPEITSK